MKFEYKVQGGNFSKAGYASSDLKKILKQLNVNPAIIKRVVVALYEAEVNIVAHAYNGTITIDIDDKQVRIVLEDQGPGIPSIEQAMQKGFSTASPHVREMGFGAGMGLPNIKKNADVMNITSKVNVGTTVEIINYI
ncbi:MAG: ATP-binding protein [Bacteroidales bacterium]|jgi:serine/threonine-protein kinase RsbT|nr:ATP-binding protein [Bacteroidales bacterium]MDD2204882.1 ATP-binding protein [Bacteroidales bacterium]MDD3151535.1 ATP-binding protein [Bacteroidales bacterium]MDD3913538.1 ATP-binding protein [Bacteroidales bacterium]MDD4634151.1 ATP-binding protein [Bacteroidales bacterium]